MDVLPVLLLRGWLLGLALVWFLTPWPLVARAGDLPEPFTDEDFLPRDPQLEELGRLLFFDKILSGNQNISCATCHHSLTGTTDFLSLPVGEGGLGLGPARDTGAGPELVPERVPRNAPAVFNLGALEVDTMFHDGRIQKDPSQPSGFLNPAGDDLPDGFVHVLEVQAMFPVTSGTEMAGQAGENPIGDAADAGNLAGPGGVWEQLAERLRAVPEYADRFEAVFDDVQQPEDITYAHAARAIAAFESGAWRFDDTPFDRYLRGDKRALSKRQKRGMALFYGEAKCFKCHAGALLSDQEFHALGVPQIGPGKGDDEPGYDDGLADFGRERVTLDPADRYRFRTPPLRNVALSGPWGHDGAYDDLEAMVRHHLDAEASLEAYDPSQAVLPPAEHLGDEDFAYHEDPVRRAALADAIEIRSRELSDGQVAKLIEFLHALTDPRAITGLRGDVPARVPSGLPVAD